MNLQHGLPSALEAGTLTISIRTGTAFWMWLACRLEQGEQDASLLAQAIESIERGGADITLHELTPEEAKAVFNRLAWFMRGGVDEPETAQEGRKSKERVLDYEKDLGAIYAAFMQSYGLDLYEDSNGEPLINNLHWWRFLALVSHLPSGSALVDYYMYYRGINLSDLPRKTDADRKQISEIGKIKRQIALDKPKPNIKKEKAYAIKARQLQQERI